MISWVSFGLCILGMTALLIAPALSHIDCTTKSHSKKDLDLMQTKLTIEKEMQERSDSSRVRCIRCITIDTYVYVFHRSNGEGSEVNKKVIDEQMQVLNSGFAKSPFRFRLMAANFVIDDLFYSRFLVNEKGEDASNPEVMTRKYPRFGDYSSLNIYFGAVDGSTSFTILPSVDGLKSVPWDGVFIYLRSVPRIYSPDITGATLTHEVSN
jgi:hypothetical protein